jgi:hypothetical protein
LIKGTGGSAIGLGVLVGIAAVPLAPIAKDLTSSLQAAVAAMQIIPRGNRR